MARSSPSPLSSPRQALACSTGTQRGVRKRLAVFALPLTLTALLLTGTAPAAALSSTGDDPTAVPAEPTSAQQLDMDELIAQLRQEVGEGNEAMILAGASLRLAEGALPAARATAAEAADLLAAAMRRQEETALLRARTQSRLMLAEQEAADVAADVTAQQDQIARLARSAYQSGGSLQGYSALLDAQSPADLAHRLVGLQAVADSQELALDDLEDLSSSYAERTQDLTVVRDALVVADKRARRELETVAALEVRARAASESVFRLVQARRAALEAVRRAAAEDAAAAARREAAAGQLGGTLAEEASRLGVTDDGPVRARPGTLRRPVAGEVTSPYGMRTHPITGVHKMHTGTDFGAPCGTPILAALGGQVIDAGWHDAYGWRTVVSHGKVGKVLLTTTYNHQTDLGVAVGDELAAGDVLGTVGSTGYSTGCHLHFELYVNGTLVDPLPWLS